MLKNLLALVAVMWAPALAGYLIGKPEGWADILGYLLCGVLQFVAIMWRACAEDCEPDAERCDE